LEQLFRTSLPGGDHHRRVAEHAAAADSLRSASLADEANLRLFRESIVFPLQGGSMRLSRISLALVVSSFLVWAAPELRAGSTIEEKPAFAPTDSFQTKGIIIDFKFKTADGSVLPAGQYMLKLQGTGKAGQVGIWVQNPKGKVVGNLLGQYVPSRQVLRESLGETDTKLPRRASLNFAELGFSPASSVKISPMGGEKGIIINNSKGGRIEALVPAVKN
jgi:hypothetical protein